MIVTNRISIEQWLGGHSNTVAVACLVVGIAGGWFIRGSQSLSASAYSVGASASAPATMGSSDMPQMPTPARLKEMADAQAAPMLEKLKSDPGNAELLAGIGNSYYDAQQYPMAVDYYGRALKSEPADAAVRTDMATAYWYMGNADAAIAEFNKALTYEPNNPNTLFNRGMVKSQAKMDYAGAVADWEKLLATSPNYQQKDKVKQLIADAKQHGAIKP
jgi:cytochrome c-type biogenesis protein CcmH/NrfG